VEPNFDLTGRVAIVTGAGGGIGSAYARGLAQAGASVVLADLNLEAAQANTRQLVDEGFAAAAVHVDVSSEESANAMAATAAERFGSVDILVNNAALMAEIMGGSLHAVPLDEWNKTLAVNLTGPLLCARACIPYMKEKGWGKIINQSSGGAFMAAAHYGVTKLGLVSMTLALAKELAPFGIRVNAIAPGWVNTDAGMRTVPAEVREALGRAIPFPFGDPQDLLGGLLLLASPAGDWITGVTLNIDGGWIPRT
jgi:NAD(P)-dependent dehydrogenase (short-subunit alcohol dehydrogenase family)